jgi:hypothetical protein
MSVLGAAYIVSRHDAGSVERTSAMSRVTPPPAAAIAPPPSPEPASTRFDLENGYSYSRLNTLADFKAKYPDAICVEDETCVSQQAMTDAETSLPCIDGSFQFEEGRAVGLSCKVNVSIGAYLIMSTTEKFGPVELVEDGQLFNMHSRHSSWFIKGGTFTVTVWNGYDFHGAPATDDVTVAFHEGRRVTALRDTQLPTAETDTGDAQPTAGDE